ncbi:ZN501 protein, partial [Burhinus bistriatus]|nr:ZN501 protein [Burhinus bistriatus]
KRSFLCTECGKSFNPSAPLLHHQRIHSGERPYPCLKGFDTPEELIPRDKRSFLCTECGKSFNPSAPLLHHQRIHSGERPYPCLKGGKPWNSHWNSH